MTFTFSGISRRAALALLAAGLLAAPVQAATITINNLDGANEGFNDPTPAAPVGGNPMTTVGAQRLFVFQTVANQWGSILPSGVQIIVNATFDPLTCTATSAVLGSAGPQTVHANFPGALLADHWYHQALANRLTGSDLAPANNDITARFNSNLNGSATCLGGTGWYLGIDGNEGSSVELYPVVLHELGHGLGFSTVTNGTTGNYTSGFPSNFDHFLRDGISGLHWDQNSAAQRVASAISLNQLSWDGPAVAYGAPLFLGPSPRLNIMSPPAAAGSYAMLPAAFGGAIPGGGLAGDLVLVDDGTAPDPNDACEAIVNGPALAGKIALLDRGTCTFVLKAAAAQAAGAIAVVIVNNAAGAFTPGGSDPSITIPVIGISQADGNLLKANLAGLHGAMLYDPSQLAGADAGGRPLMYAPNPFQSGSSVSHYDVSLSPNALMEPAINNDLHDNVDLTLNAFSDIGWLEFATATTLSLFRAEDRQGGIWLEWEFSEPVSNVTIQRATNETGPWDAVGIPVTVENGRNQALDTTVETDREYYYRLAVQDRTGQVLTYGLAVGRHASSVEGPAVLFAPRPNPAAHSSTVAFRLSRPEFVEVSIADASGRTVSTLQQGMLAAGDHAILWDGTSKSAGRVPAGLYFVTLRTSEGRSTQRLAIVR